jgi:NTE family protein
MKERMKIGLALGGGGARGLAHIGVLKVLQQEMVPIDMIAGTSAGALIGAIFAQNKDVSVIESIALQFDKKKLISLLDFSLRRSGFIGGRKVTSLLKLIMGSDVTFSDLRIPLACVAANISACEEVVIDQGSVLEAVRASISVPGIFTAVKWKGSYLVDGGLGNPVPVGVVKRMGADFVIAVNVIPDIHERAYEVGEETKRDLKEPSIFSVIVKSMERAQCLLVRSCTQDADIVINPKVAHIGFGDFYKVRECVKQGEIAAQDSILEIKRRLEI